MTDGCKTTLPAGAPVRLRAMAPPGHVRCPWYLRGKTGVIERDLGVTLDPEALAYGREARRVRLYRVRFSMAEVWGDDAERPGDRIDAEIFETWIEEPDHAA